MNPKIIASLVSVLISFVVLMILSFFTSKLLLNSSQDFMSFFQEKWLMILAIVIIFVGYKHFFGKRKEA